MGTIKRDAFLWVCIILILLIWVGLMKITGTPLSINWEAIKLLPDVVTVFVVICFMFTKWLWRWKMFRGWIVLVPDIQGTWSGELQSTWINPSTNKEYHRCA